VNVRIVNYAQVPFVGWKRTTIDWIPPHPSGQVGDVVYVVGRQIGRDTRVIDLLVGLAPGQERDIDFSTAQPVDFRRGPLPEDPLAHFGGPLRIAGVDAQWLSLQPDGAGYTAHLRARTGPMLVADVFFTWFPSLPGHCLGECVVTASNPACPDKAVFVPPDYTLQFGDAITFVPGLAPGAPIIAANTKMVCGQARGLPLSFVWPRLMRNPSDWGSFAAAANLQVCAVGIEKLLPLGNPTYPPTFNPRAWTNQYFGEAVRRLHTFEAAVTGPAPHSAMSGPQEGEQIFVRG
jgi:hypothetical protein